MRACARARKGRARWAGGAGACTGVGGGGHGAQARALGLGVTGRGQAQRSKWPRCVCCAEWRAGGGAGSALTGSSGLRALPVQWGLSRPALPRGHRLPPPAPCPATAHVRSLRASKPSQLPAALGSRGAWQGSDTITPAPMHPSATGTHAPMPSLGQQPRAPGQPFPPTRSSVALRPQATHRRPINQGR